MAGSGIEVARETIDCFNAGDWERLRALHTPDCVEEELATERRLEGFDAMLEAARGWKRAFPDGRGTVLVGGTRLSPFPSDQPGFDKVTMADFFSHEARRHRSSFQHARIELYPGEIDKLW